MKIICLAENTSVNENIGYEHGLSLYIEVNNLKILFDMGQSDLFIHNAKKLGVDLSQVDIAVLSHGHYDHGGGLKAFMDINSKAPVYISQYAFEPHYNGTEKYIGLDVCLKDSKQFHVNEDFLEIANGLSLFHLNKSTLKHPINSGGLNMLQNGELLAEDFRHEQYLLLEENAKRLLISGCSHKGVLNIMESFSPDIFIGGFHFSKFPLDEKLKDYAQYLDSFNTTYYTCHCTGVEQFEFMEKYMSKASYLSSGQIIEL